MRNNSRSPNKLRTNRNDNTLKYLIIVERESGYCIPTKATTPIEFVPYGFYTLPFIGTLSQAEKQIRKYQRNPWLLEKYTDV